MYAPPKIESIRPVEAVLTFGNKWKELFGGGGNSGGGQSGGGGGHFSR